MYAGDCQTLLNINNVPGNLKLSGEIIGVAGLADGIGEVAEGGSLLSKIGQAVRWVRGLLAADKEGGIIYERINKADPTEKPYIGRANSEERYAARQKEHARANPDADYEFKVVERAKPGQPLRQAEQRNITSRGGPTNKSNPDGGLSNRRNEIAQPRICRSSQTC